MFENDNSSAFFFYTGKWTIFIEIPGSHRERTKWNLKWYYAMWIYYVLILSWVLLRWIFLNTNLILKSYLSFLCLFGCVGSWLLRAGFSSCEQRLLSSCGAWASRRRARAAGRAGQRLWHAVVGDVLVLVESSQTRLPCIGRWILNHWTAREVQYYSFLNLKTLVSF